MDVKEVRVALFGPSVKKRKPAKKKMCDGMYYEPIKQDFCELKTFDGIQKHILHNKKALEWLPVRAYKMEEGSLYVDKNNSGGLYRQSKLTLKWEFTRIERNAKRGLHVIPSDAYQMLDIIKKLVSALKWEAYNNIPNDKARADNTKRVLAMIEESE